MCFRTSVGNGLTDERIIEIATAHNFFWTGFYVKDQENIYINQYSGGGMATEWELKILIKRSWPHEIRLKSLIYFFQLLLSDTEG